MRTYPDTLEMFTVHLSGDEFLRIELSSSWERGDRCCICGEEIPIGTVTLEYLNDRKACSNMGCEHADDDGDCSRLIHRKAHFRHLAADFSVLPAPERELAQRHGWAGLIR